MELEEIKEKTSELDEIKNGMSLEDNTDKSDETDESEIAFADLGLDEQTLAAVAHKGFVTPSPIQILAIPRLLNGEANVIARARTGTGKTAAFGLPLVQKLREKGSCVRALILEPTRELAMQTCAELQSFTEGACPRTCVLYGGASYINQLRDLKRGAEIVVGTPGRIQDHIERRTLDISKIDYFILDEGDEMLDMGFVDDIEKIFKSANPNSRILLFSATMPDPILKIAGKFMGEYEIVEEEGVIDEPLLIEQKYWVLRENEKIDALVRLIDISDDFYGLVFTQTKMDADQVARALDERGYESAALHGDIAQNQREKILARFRSKKTRIVVATDVAARGIDITGLSHVVNFSLPFDGATYVHRIGRTGRAGSAGIAVTFVRPEEVRKLSFLQRAVRRASKGEMTESSVPSIDDVLENKRTRLFNQLKEKIGLSCMTETAQKAAESDFPDTENAADNETASSIPTEASDEIVSEAADENLSKASADDAPSSRLKKAEPLFVKMADELCAEENPKDVLASVLSVMYSRELDKSRYGRIQNGRKGAGSSGGGEEQTRIYIQLGRRDGYNPRGIADYFSDLLHIPGRLVDRIDVSSNFSLVSLPVAMAKRALDLSQHDGKMPHMHIDVRAGGSGGDFGGDRRRSGSGGGRGRGRFGGGREKEFDGDRERNRSGNYGARSYKSKGNRSNFHTSTERSASAGLYKKKSGNAERF